MEKFSRAVPKLSLSIFFLVCLADETGKEIHGLEAITDANTVIFHSGTKREESKIVTTGGRVLGVTALGKNIEEAIERAYTSVDKILFEKCFFRRDIAAKALSKIVGSKNK